MTKHHTEAVQHSSRRATWRTPRDLFDALNHEFAFGLDAAAEPASRLVGQWLGPGSAVAEDALAVDWSAITTGPIFCNPPYSRLLGIAIMPWVEKCATTAEQGCTVVAVLPLSPQTRWFRAHVWSKADEIRLIPHRVTFIDPETSEPAHNAPGNTCIVVWRGRLRRELNPDPRVFYWGYRA